MGLADYYFYESRLTLVAIEHLTPQGLRDDAARLFVARAGWSAAHVELFNAGFHRYWERTTGLAARLREWAPPRLRHVAIVRDPLTVRPYVQLLNTSAWLLYESDFDPARSDPEFVAYLLVHGDRMAITGEVTTAAIHDAAYWFERTDAACAAFAAAAQATRPDAAAFRALADALPWLRQLRHAGLRPVADARRYRTLSGTGLLVPPPLHVLPPALVQQWTTVARTAVAQFHAHWRARDATTLGQLCDWLATAAPPLLITTHGDRVLWDPETPSRLGALRAALRDAGAGAVHDVSQDLKVIDRHTRQFLASLVDPAALPAPDAATAQSGYSFLHRQRRLIAYNLHEPGMERLHGPALPFARAMLGARTVHEWTHLAVDAGWVPPTGPAARLLALAAGLATELDATIAAAPAAVRQRTAGDLAALRVADIPVPRGALHVPGDSAGTRLVQLLLTRLPDYQANVLAQRYLDTAERETYVRQNIRTLRPEYTADQLWRMLVRYLAEYQYLGFSALPDRRTFFVASTWFDADFIATGVLTAERFDALTAAVAALCATYAVDERRFKNLSGPSVCWG